MGVSLCYKARPEFAPLMAWLENSGQQGEPQSKVGVWQRGEGVLVVGDVRVVIFLGRTKHQQRREPHPSACRHLPSPILRKS
jgi:hypothetical protein